MTASTKRFGIRTALNDQIRNAEVRAQKRGDLWEVQVYLLPRPGANRLLAPKERMGTPVVLDVDSEQEALDEMMRRLKKYFQLEIEETS